MASVSNDNKLGGLKQRKLIPSQFQKPGVGRAVLPLGENPFLVPPSPGGSAFLGLWLHPSCFCLQVTFPPLLGVPALLGCMSLHLGRYRLNGVLLNPYVEAITPNVTVCGAIALKVIKIKGGLGGGAQFHRTGGLNGRGRGISSQEERSHQKATLPAP